MQIEQRGDNNIWNVANKEIQLTSSTKDFILEAVSLFKCFFLFARSSSEVQNT